MEDNNRKMGEDALVRAVRALDQGDIETVPERLERIWNTLENYREGSAHAVEEMLLRWLLKNMTGTSTSAERVRRYAGAWDILGAIFALVPLFSLAKSLADRRFVAILQQTLKDIAAPQQDADLDVEMVDAPVAESPANPRKRKRAEPASFDIKVQKQTRGCLQTAEAVFGATRTLLSRCETGSLDEPAIQRMGAEHVKSLFSSPASETMGTLVPWVTICGLAIDYQSAGGLRDQASWLSTFVALWELHLHGAADASEVATHLSGAAARLLGRLQRSTEQTPLMGNNGVQNRWARDLRRFLARNLIMPARAAFLTGGSQEVVQTTLTMSTASAHVAFPVLFDLVSKSPLEFRGKTSRKDYETWVQTVFDAILHAAKNVNRESNLTAVKAIVELAAERSTPLSSSSLRAVCKNYALRGDRCDWGLLLSMAKLNPDVFLISEEGKQILDQVLEQTLESGSLDAQDSKLAARFIVLLADGYAQARDLSSFAKVWLKQLASTAPKASLQPLWSQKPLSDAVAKLVQSSLTTTQLVELLEWLSSQTGSAESMARIHILDAISSGISQEDYVDAANMKTSEAVFLVEFSKKEPPAISACRWMVASKTFARGTLEEAEQVWSKIKSDIKSILRKFPVAREDTFAAFKCCVAAWLANHPGASYEDDIFAMLCSFIERLDQEGQPMELDGPDQLSPVSRGTYLSWILSDAPRLISLLVERKSEVPSGILGLLTASENQLIGTAESALSVSRLLLQQESLLNNRKLMDLLIDTVVSMLDISKAGRSEPSTKIAIQFLLDIPLEVLNRSQREAATKALLSQLPGEGDKAGKGETTRTEYWQGVLRLVARLMTRPTFYEGMSFSHLDALGRCLLRQHKRSSRSTKEDSAAEDISRDWENFRLLKQVAVLTIRQMTSGTPEEREKSYLDGAISLLQSPCDDSDRALRIVLLDAFVSTVQSSPAIKKLAAEGLDLASGKKHLLEMASQAIMSERRNGKGLLALLSALEALGDLDREEVKRTLSGAAPSLVALGDSLLAKGVQAGWEVRMFLVNYFPEAVKSPWDIKMSLDVPVAAGEDEETESGEAGEVGEDVATLGKTALLRYVDAVVKAADQDTRLGYVQELLERSDTHDELGRLLVIYRVIRHLKGSRPSESSDQFGLAQAHSTLCRRLSQATSPAAFLLTSKAIHLLLDQSPACMTQWNIDLTLSTVSDISAQASTQALISDSPNIYPSLCRLVEMVIKRHRKRLDGHFHALVTALQSLFRLLLSRPHNPLNTTTTITTTPTNPTNSTADTSPHRWEHHAKLFSRLLTLICEPTVASVSRSSGGVAHAGALDSDKDRAKRYAGRFVPPLLAQYVRLLLAHAVPHGVAAALEPGVYAMLDVATQEGLRGMNDGLDAGGRVVFRELWRRWERFGKWSGV